MKAADRYVAMEKFAVTASATDATNNYVEVVMPYVAKGIIARVRKADGTLNEAGIVITQPTGKIRVAVTDLLANDVVSILAFE